RRDVPAEGAQLALEVAEPDDLLGRLVGLKLVAVDDHPEAAQRLLCCGLQRFEVLPLLKLAVASHDDDSSPSSEQALRPRHATAFRAPHPERAAVRLDP